MKSTAVWKKGFQSVLDNGRGHEIFIDLPEQKGGENIAPTALELCVMSMAGCVSTIFNLLAKKMRIDFEKLEVEVFAEQENNAPTITDVCCVVKIKTDSSEEKVTGCLEKAIETCPVGYLFNKAGVKITHEVIMC